MYQDQFEFPSSNSSSNCQISDIHSKAEALLKQTKIPSKYSCDRILYQSQNSTLFLCYEGKNPERKVLKIGIGCKEVGILNKLGNHPHIVQVEEYGQNWLIMPYYSGTLSRFIEKTIQPLPLQTITQLLHDISHALTFIHEKGVIHGDVKSDNILYREEEGGKKVFFLCDFGNSFSEKEETPHSTQTLPYKYPDNAENDKQRIDKWGLGCILFECMTGNTLLPLQIQTQTEYEKMVKTNTTKQHIGKELERWSSRKHLDMFREKLLLLLERGGSGKGRELMRMLGLQ